MPDLPIISASKPRYTEGRAPYDIPAAKKSCETWYRVYGSLESGKRPLVCVHGGPGVGHNYLISIGEDMSTNYGIPCILYDQVGCGNSTLIPEKKGDTSFFTIQLFLNEFDNLLKHLKVTDYDYFGNSWGGMLGMEHCIRQPKGLRKAILADAPCSMITWQEETMRLRTLLPKEVSDVLDKHEQNGTTDSVEYQDATKFFYARHVCRVQPMPQDVQDTFANLTVDSTVYHTMNGPNEFLITGSLKTWDVTDQLHKINVPTLILNGRYDEATDKNLLPTFQRVEKIKWANFADSSHMPHWEERERFMEVVAGFLK